MLLPFDLYVSTRATFGWGALARLGDLVWPLGNSALLVTGRHSAKQTGHLARVVDLLQQRGVRVEVFDRVTPNPRTQTVDDGARLVREHRLAMVIGVGGGSVIDAAKAIAVAAVSDRPVADYIWGGIPLPAGKVPLVAIPTTAGTGSELSRGAILTDETTGRKSGLRGEVCLPTHALVDAELTVSMPPAVTAQTGFDAWSHALETFLSRKANPFTEALSIGAMERIVEFLPRVVRDGSDADARTQMSAASAMMGWNLGLATTCLPHRLQYPVGAKTDSTHALGIAALHLAWLRQIAPFAAAKLARVSAILAPRYAQRAGSGDDCAQLAATFMADIGVTTCLRDLGVLAVDCRQLAADVTGDVASDPGPSDQAAFLSIYEQSL